MVDDPGDTLHRWQTMDPKKLAAACGRAQARFVQERERSTAELLSELFAATAPRDKRLVERLVGKSSWLGALGVLAAFGLGVYFIGRESFAVRVGAIVLGIAFWGGIWMFGGLQHLCKARIARFGHAVMARVVATGDRRAQTPNSCIVDEGVGYRLELPDGATTTSDFYPTHLSPELPEVTAAFVLTSRKLCLVVLPLGGTQVLDIPNAQGPARARVVRAG